MIMRNLELLNVTRPHDKNLRPWNGSFEMISLFVSFVMFLFQDTNSYSYREHGGLFLRTDEVFVLRECFMNGKLKIQKLLRRKIREK